MEDREKRRERWRAYLARPPNNAKTPTVIHTTVEGSPKQRQQRVKKHKAATPGKQAKTRPTLQQIRAANRFLSPRRAQ
jgi:hypothetical protein